MASSFSQILRRWHLYLGVLAAPSLLFFAITGGLQVFSLHETTRGSTYTPPRILMALGQIHKKQTDVLPQGRKPGLDRPSEARPEKSRPEAAAPVAKPAPVWWMTRHPLGLKIFFAVISLALVLSTISGIQMAYRFSPSNGIVHALLLIGVALPVVLVFV